MSKQRSRTSMTNIYIYIFMNKQQYIKKEKGTSRKRPKVYKWYTKEIKEPLKQSLTNL